MKRDWDLLRQQLTDIEEGRDVLAKILDSPKWTDDLTWEEYDSLAREHRAIEEQIAGHLELLIDSGYVEGITVLRGADNHFSYGVHAPRLTMAGHDLLDTMRSSSVWEAIKSTARTKGIELTFDAIKALSGLALKHVLGG
ncbi:DUF2513 domain-containing protein [Burkholderia ubonensis]|uniref:DUF2513 domain-containing protein n=1 Tax=Burkholderia ubonensis TaxID=101571 RepID=UPI00075B9CA3|nr:DUF2513 domain-containing protein [Burkholderia ubonensis]AOI68116.1 hypothetical protein WI31_00480 [Burkholderia ubonensis]KUZ22926.1 hypothetical protein WI29_11965 [Burkholderia ubonensis]KUZ24672.1 hypothetical protein WI32_33135 [Burkholderia ubonensis]KUZ36604.1 hypothetical protein WI30_07715 [Burkholderia ubonensis]KUZ51386.1 hypothetical protein WI33_12470 [Burkholderia ubonensis]